MPPIDFVREAGAEGRGEMSELNQCVPPTANCVVSHAKFIPRTGAITVMRGEEISRRLCGQWRAAICLTVKHWQPILHTVRLYSRAISTSQTQLGGRKLALFRAFSVPVCVCACKCVCLCVYFAFY